LSAALATPMESRRASPAESTNAPTSPRKRSARRRTDTFVASRRATSSMFDAN
jgi:hypothetical protein